jgi:NAD(P)H-hydrate epimerase
MRRALLPVVTSAQSAARDAAAISAGTPSRALMQRAGAAAAAEIALRLGDRLNAGVLLFAGPGNNGGDAWVVARALAAAGVAARVVEPLPAKTHDAVAERALALPRVELTPWDSTTTATPWRGERVVVDGLLGTGATGAPRGAIADATRAIGLARAGHAYVVSLDVPTGVDASSGEASTAVTADLTLTFGTIKRGHLVARSACGQIVVLDIGLALDASPDDAPRLVDERWVAARVPRIDAGAHKGSRKKLAIVGGAPGMTGAAILAARAAMASGIGMVKLVVENASLPVVQESEPYALAGTWPTSIDSVENEIASWADAVVIGPGLGRSATTRALVENVLEAWHGPVLLDADALNVFEGASEELGRLLNGASRQALLTPHPVEFGRLSQVSAGEVLSRRFEIGGELARRIGATVLLKGVPTIITSSVGEALVSATGTPALATAGSGDVLAGIAGTLLAQTDDAHTAGAAGAWVHGRAAESAARSSSEAPPRVRGLTLADVLAAVPLGWVFDTRPLRYPVLAELPFVGERA